MVYRFFQLRVYLRVSYGCGGFIFLGFRVLLRLGFARFIYRFVGFRAFHFLEVFSR